jgi:mRNA-degrading endonuclease RelE of RelBE toxin-antitoxin system
MAYRVDIAARAARDLKALALRIRVNDTPRARAWFEGLRELIYSLDALPERGAVTPENPDLRHLTYGTKPHIYRIIYQVDQRAQNVTVLHIRHSAQDAFNLG